MAAPGRAQVTAGILSLRAGDRGRVLQECLLPVTVCRTGGRDAHRNVMSWGDAAGLEFLRIFGVRRGARFLPARYLAANFCNEGRHRSFSRLEQRTMVEIARIEGAK
jgi:hypothetical protein